MSIPAELAAVVQQVRREVSDLHAELPRNELVVWTAGNVSARVPGRWPSWRVRSWSKSVLMMLAPPLPINGRARAG